MNWMWFGRRKAHVGRWGRVNCTLQRAFLTWSFYLFSSRGHLPMYRSMYRRVASLSTCKRIKVPTILLAMEVHGAQCDHRCFDGHLGKLSVSSAKGSINGHRENWNGDSAPKNLEVRKGSEGIEVRLPRKDTLRTYLRGWRGQTGKTDPNCMHEMFPWSASDVNYNHCRFITGWVVHYGCLFSFFCSWELPSTLSEVFQLLSASENSICVFVNTFHLFIFHDISWYLTISGLENGWSGLSPICQLHRGTLTQAAAESAFASGAPAVSVPRVPCVPRHRAGLTMLGLDLSLDLNQTWNQHTNAMLDENFDQA